jgi:hypothetical protein
MYVGPFNKTINIDGQVDPVYKQPVICSLQHWSNDSTIDRQISTILRNYSDILHP